MLIPVPNADQPAITPGTSRLRTTSIQPSAPLHVIVVDPDHSPVAPDESTRHRTRPRGVDLHTTDVRIPLGAPVACRAACLLFGEDLRVHEADGAAFMAASSPSSARDEHGRCRLLPFRRTRLQPLHGPSARARAGDRGGAPDRAARQTPNRSPPSPQLIANDRSPATSASRTRRRSPSRPLLRLGGRRGQVWCQDDPVESAQRRVAGKARLRIHRAQRRQSASP